MTNLTAIQERFDALAAEALEELLQEVEARDPVRVVALRVTLVPDAGRDSACPTVEVHLTVEHETLSGVLARGADRPGKRPGVPGVH